jgi:hypothetical protein
MGYAFLYGVIGSLFGSSMGAYLYTRVAKPGNPRLFFLIFFALGLAGFLGLILYDRFFSADTETSNRRARRIVVGVYLVLALAGAGMGIGSLLSTVVSYKTLIQAVILLLVGIGGLVISRRGKDVVK